MLTPLIDIIFLLVMFFLLSSTFGIWRPLSVGLAKQSTAAATEPAAAGQQDAEAGGYGVFIVVMPGQATGGGVAPPRVLVNGEAVALDALSHHLDALAARGARAAVLQPAASATLQDIVRVLDLARASRLTDVTMSFH